MATVIQPADQPVLMDGVSWETYEALLADGGDCRQTRMAFDQGVLEIVTPSYEHERFRDVASGVAEEIPNARGQDYLRSGSTTFKQEGLGRGFEPDASFYVAHTPRVWGLSRIDLSNDPPPDLVIEIDVARSSLDKLPIYAALGVPEIWRYRADRVYVYRLVNSSYVEVDQSEVLPGLQACNSPHLHKRDCGSRGRRGGSGFTAGRMRRGPISGHDAGQSNHMQSAT